MAVRVQWSSLPPHVTRWVEDRLGGRVVQAVTQANGFSSGSADVVETQNGRRAFVKTVSRERNNSTFQLHRTEAWVMRKLPRQVRAPELLGVFDDDEWVALLLAEVDGRHPGDRGGADIPAVLDALAELPIAHGPLAALPRLSDELADAFDGWRRLIADGADGADATLPQPARAWREQLLEASARACEAVAGDHLVHQDCRADNILIDRAGLRSAPVGWTGSPTFSTW